MSCTENYADAGKHGCEDDDYGDDGDDEEDGRDPVGSATAAANSDQNAKLALDVAYLSLFSVVGLTLRAYMGRFFGGDCEAYHAGGGGGRRYTISSGRCLTSFA
jgi:hypothetical protein